MKINLEATFKALGLPVGLLIIFGAILGMFGVQLDTILLIVEGLAGTFALIALLINLFKYVGAINDGVAGKLSLIGNLIVTITVAVVFKLYPQFDFNGVDAQIAEFVRVVGIVIAYGIQLAGTKSIHLFLTRGLNLRVFSYTLQQSWEAPF